MTFRIRLKNVRIKGDKIETVTRMAAGQRKNQAMKAARKAKAWKAKSKGKP